MAGLMKSGAPTDVQAGGQAQAVEETPNVTPQEQKEYERFVSNGLNMIYDPKGLKKIVKSLRGGDNPVEGLANTLVSVVQRLEQSARQSGNEVSGDVMLQGGVELLETLVEMSEKAGIHEFSEKDMETALFMAMDNYRFIKQSQGQLPDEVMKADFQRMLQAEQDGTLEDILPGIGEYAARYQQEQEEGAPQGLDQGMPPQGA